jgi:hypothetical protein
MLIRDGMFRKQRKQSKADDLRSGKADDLRSGKRKYDASGSSFSDIADVVKLSYSLVYCIVY